MANQGMYDVSGTGGTGRKQETSCWEWTLYILVGLLALLTIVNFALVLWVISTLNMNSKGIPSMDIGDDSVSIFQNLFVNGIVSAEQYQSQGAVSLSSQSDIAITSTGTTTISGADVDVSLSGAASTFDVIDSAASPILRASTGGTTFQKAVQASAGATLSGASTVLGTLNVQSGASFTADAGSTITFNSLPNFNSGVSVASGKVSSPEVLQLQGGSSIQAGTVDLLRLSASGVGANITMSSDQVVLEPGSAFEVASRASAQTVVPTFTLCVCKTTKNLASGQYVLFALPPGLSCAQSDPNDLIAICPV